MGIFKIIYNPNLCDNQRIGILAGFVFDHLFLRKSFPGAEFWMKRQKLLAGTRQYSFWNLKQKNQLAVSLLFMPLTLQLPSADAQGGDTNI